MDDIYCVLFAVLDTQTVEDCIHRCTSPQLDSNSSSNGRFRPSSLRAYACSYFASLSPNLQVQSLNPIHPSDRMQRVWSGQTEAKLVWPVEQSLPSARPARDQQPELGRNSFRQSHPTPSPPLPSHRKTGCAVGVDDVLHKRTGQKMNSRGKCQAFAKYPVN